MIHILTTVIQSSATQTSGTIALRTIHVYLKNGTKKVKVNAPLDDASAKTQILQQSLAYRDNCKG